MRYAKIENGKVANVIALQDEDLPLMPADWELIKSETANIGDDYVNGVFVAQAPQIIVISLEQAKAAKITQIRQEQAEQINALAWRVERAKERELIGAAGESVIEVLTLREGIRQKGNLACANVEMLTDLQSVQIFDWSI